MVSTDPRPTSAKRIPGQVVRDFVEALGLNPDQITQVYIGPRLITVHLRLDLGEGMLNQLMREHPGVTVRGDSTHVEADISFAVDWEAT
jgi:hypothetical protein